MIHHDEYSPLFSTTCFELRIRTFSLGRHNMPPICDRRRAWVPQADPVVGDRPMILMLGNINCSKPSAKEISPRLVFAF